MLDPVFLFPAALLTGAIALGHLFFLKRCLGDYEGEKRVYKEFECRVIIRVFGLMSLVASCLLAYEQLIQ